MEELSSKGDKIINKDKLSLKDDIIFFKEELLKYMNILEKSFSQQKKEIQSDINGKFILYDENIDKIKQTVSELTKMVITNKYLKEQVEGWSQFKNDITKISTDNRVKLSLFEKDINKNIDRIDNILTSTVIYPMVIGKTARFKTFHDFIDYALEQISLIDIFRGKIDLDIKTFKEKMDKTVQHLQIQLDSSINDAKQIVKNGVAENEISIKDYIDSKVFDVKVKTSENEQKVENKFEDFNKGLIGLIEKIKLINEKLEEKINIDNFDEEKDLIYDYINQCKTRDEELNDRINKLEKYNLTLEKNLSLLINNLNQEKEDNNIDTNSSETEDLKNKENIEIKDNLDNKKEKNKINQANKRNKNQLILNLTADTNGNVNNSNDLNNNKKINNSTNINSNFFNNNINYNNKLYGTKENKKVTDKKVITSLNKRNHDDNITNNILTNIVNNIENNIIKENTRKINKAMKSLNKLRISLKDINAQLNLGNLYFDKNDKSLKTNYIQRMSMVNSLSNKNIDFNQLIPLNQRNQLKNIIVPETLRNLVTIKNNEIQYFDKEPLENRKSEFTTEGPIIKDKNKKIEERKKAWERLISPKTKVNSDLNNLAPYFVNFRNIKKNKTLKRTHMSQSSKNFISNFYKG